jgi:hypothetical protein
MGEIDGLHGSLQGQRKPEETLTKPLHQVGKDLMNLRSWITTCVVGLEHSVGVLRGRL